MLDSIRGSRVKLWHFRLDVIKRLLHNVSVHKEIMKTA